MLQLPSDTSHFLQPCDQKVNRVLKRGVKAYCDILTEVKSKNLSSVSSKPILAVIVLKCASPTEIIESFEKRGLCTMDFRFMTSHAENNASYSVQQESAFGRIPDADTLRIQKSNFSAPGQSSIILHKASL